MSLKEFDAKQFLLEKGERVGLGVAVTLMVLMLLLSLFMPKSGFFSGSPAGKAKELNGSTDRLETALRSNTPKESDLPEKREGKLIAFNTTGLDTDNYGTELWFEPRMKESKARRPPKIYPVAEAVAQVAEVPIDQLFFRLEAQPPQILVLADKDRKAGVAGPGNLPGGAGGMGNPFAPLLRGMPGAKGVPGGSMMQRQQQQVFGTNSLGSVLRLQGAIEENLETRWLPLDDWNPQQLTAHQPRPMRMAIIAGAFPYKEQLKEHQTKLHLKSTDDVLNETIGEKDKQTAAFDFRGVEVERMEVDADGNSLGDWTDPQLKESYQYWLQQTYIPFQPEDPKYKDVEPNDGRGLVMPLLREFRATKADAPGLPGYNMFPGMMGRGGMFPGMPGGKGPFPQPTQPNTANAPPADENKSRYPDVAAELSKIKETLDNIQKAQPKEIAQAKKFQRAGANLDVFDANSAQPTDNNQNQNASATTPGGAAAGERYVPDYVLVRVVDVNIEPGKHYKYRLKVKMANPNYHKDDVASPEYKEKETLSSDWFPMDQIVTAPPEQFFYVVDEAQGVSWRQINSTITPESAQYRMMRASKPTPTDEQVVFQFHRWVDTTQQSRKETEQIPVGEWAVAERVYVARGEYVGRKVNVDIPIWKYTQNRYILPALPDAKINRRAGGKVNTGIDVDFGQDPPESNMILVDFEGGRLSRQTPKVDDTCALEVLMLSPEGKLLARNSTKDTADEERIKRREAVLKRIQDVREGKGID